MKNGEYLLSRFNLVKIYGETPLSKKEAQTFALAMKLKYNVALEKTLINALTKEMVKPLEKLISDYVGGIANTFYKNFPADVPANEVTFFINAIMHYETGMMSPLIETEIDPKWEKDAHNVLDKVNAEPTITLKYSPFPEVDAIEKLRESNTLTDNDYMQVINMIKRGVIDEISTDNYVNGAKNRMLAMAIALGFNERRNSARFTSVKTASDVVKYMQLLYAYRKNSGRINKQQFVYKYSHYDTNILLSMLMWAKERQKEDNFKADLKANLMTFKNFVNNIYVKGLSSSDKIKFVKELKQILYEDKLISVYGRVEQLIANKQYGELFSAYPTLALRNLSRFADDLDELSTDEREAIIDILANDASLSALISAHNAFNWEANESNRVIKGGYGFNVVDDKPVKRHSDVLDEALVKAVHQPFIQAYNAIKEQIEENDEAIDEEVTPIEYALPTSDKHEGDVVATPYTSVIIPDGVHQISAYVKWFADTDIDLSASIFGKEKWQNQYCSYFDPCGIDGAKHSGDITCNPHLSEPVSERIIVDLDKVNEPLLFTVIDFKGASFDKDKASFGVQLIKEDNRILGENNEDTLLTFPIYADSSRMATLLYLPETRQLVVLNVPDNVKRCFMNVDNSADAQKVLVDFFIDNVKNDLTLKELFLMNGKSQNDAVLNAIKHTPELAEEFIKEFYA